MKAFTSMVILFVSLSCLSLKAQGDSIYTWLDIQSFNLEDLSAKLEQAILSESIKVFEGDIQTTIALKELKRRELLQRTYFGRSKSDSIYADSVFTIFPFSNWLQGYQVLSINQGREPIAIAPVYSKEELIETYEESFVYYDWVDEVTFWIRWEDVKKTLGDTSRDWQRIAASQRPLLTLKDNILPAVILEPDKRGNFTDILTTIHMKIEIGDVHCFYENLVTTYTFQEIAKRAVWDSIIQVYPDLNDPYYYIDSVVRFPFEQAVEGFLIKASGKEIIAIAPFHLDKLDGLQSPALNEMFWLKWKELEEALTPKELKQLQKLLINALE